MDCINIWPLSYLFRGHWNFVTMFSSLSVSSGKFLFWYLYLYLITCLPHKLHTWYQSATWLMIEMTVILDRSRSNVQKLAKNSQVKVRFSSKWVKKGKQLATSQMLFHPQTSYLIPKYNLIRCIQRPNVKVTDQGQIFPKLGKKLNKWPYLGCYFTLKLHHIYHNRFLWLIWALF